MRTYCWAIGEGHMEDVGLRLGHRRASADRRGCAVSVERTACSKVLQEAREACKSNSMNLDMFAVGGGQGLAATRGMVRRMDPVRELGTRDPARVF